MGTAAALLAFLSAFALPHPPQEAGDLVRMLEDPDPAARDEAAQRLQAMGEEALPELARASRTAGGESKVRILGLVAAIRQAAVLGKIRIETDLPDAPATPDRIRSGDWSFKIRIRNDNDHPVVLWPYWTLAITDREGKAVPQKMVIGRFGGRMKECFLENVSFLTLKAGKQKELKATLSGYLHDPVSLQGWDLGPGDYSLRLHTSFRRAEFQASCECPANHHNPMSPWAAALELERTLEAKLSVRP